MMLINDARAGRRTQQTVMGGTLLGRQVGSTDVCIIYVGEVLTTQRASNARKAMWDFWFYSRDEQWPRDPSYPTVPSFNHHDTLRQAFLDDKNADPPPSAVILDDSERGHLGLQTQTVDTHILGAKEDERNGFEDNENDGAQAMTDVRNDDGDTIGEEAVEIEDGDVEMNDADAEGGEDDTQKRQEVIDLTGSETDSEDGSSSGDDADDEDEESEEEEVGEDKPAAGQPSARSGGFTPINAADRPAEWVPQDL